MKKKLSFLILLMCLFLFSGCSNLNPFNSNNNNSNSQAADDTNTDTNIGKTDAKTSSLTIKDYYPFKENTKYQYEGKGSEYASYSLYTDYIKDSKMQVRINTGGTEAIKVLELKDNELKLLFSKGEAYYREDLTSKTSTDSEVLLKEPLTKGTTWTLSNGKKRYISNIDVDIATASGNYKALEVTTEDGNSKILDYYAKDIGLVKTINKANNLEVTSTLNNIQKDYALPQTVKFFYPNSKDNKFYYMQLQLNFKTNDITKSSFEKYFKAPPDQSLGKLLGADVKIKSLYLNKDNMVYVDFTSNLVSQMNTGSGYENMILQCITNTLGTYYNVNKVYITIEGNPYSSGHIVMKKGEAFTVNTKNCSELKK